MVIPAAGVLFLCSRAPSRALRRARRAVAGMPKISHASIEKYEIDSSEDFYESLSDLKDSALRDSVSTGASRRAHLFIRTDQKTHELHERASGLVERPGWTVKKAQ